MNESTWPIPNAAAIASTRAVARWNAACAAHVTSCTPTVAAPMSASAPRWRRHSASLRAARSATPPCFAGFSTVKCAASSSVLNVLKPHMPGAKKNCASIESSGAESTGPPPSAITAPYTAL